jgi:hypothetical protein
MQIVNRFPDNLVDGALAEVCGHRRLLRLQRSPRRCFAALTQPA